MSQNISPEDNQLEKKYEQQTPSTTMQEILPGLYLGEYVFLPLTSQAIK